MNTAIFWFRNDLHLHDQLALHAGCAQGRRHLQHGRALYCARGLGAPRDTPHNAARFDTWRAGAAWYEHYLVDDDVHSNQGNWLYLAGRGTDPQGGRRFNPVQQASADDPDGAYRRLWGPA